MVIREAHIYWEKIQIDNMIKYKIYKQKEGPISDFGNLHFGDRA